MSSEPLPADTVVSVRNVGKCYEMYPCPLDRLKQTLWRGRRQFYEEFWALRDVSFDLHRGELLGVIGRNGSGKSTLLQLIAGTLNPTCGQISVAGRVTALLELGSGFNHEFTGRENVFLNGAILGLSEAEVAERFDEIARLLANEPAVKPGLTDPDEVPEPPDEPVTQPGDLWVLGDHRLLCGDAGKTEDADRLLDGATIDLVSMDPPYNVKVEPRSSTAIAAGLSSHPDLWKKMYHQSFDVARGVTDPAKARKKIRAKDRPLENDFVSAEAFDEMLRVWFANAARVLKPGGSFYIWGGYANLGNYPAPLKAAGLYFSQGIVWHKQHPVLTRKDMMGCFELVFYAWKEGAGHHFFGPNNATDLWHVKKVNPQSMVHLTEKPVDLAVRAIQYSSRPGENVLDLFGGSACVPLLCQQCSAIKRRSGETLCS